MKKLKKVRNFAVLLLAMLTLFSATSITAQEQAAPLRFDNNGNFRILVIADTQDVVNPKQPTLDLMNAALDEAKPDLVVFTGDNIFGPDKRLNSEEKVEKAIRQIMEPVTSRNLPFAIVFGNHDDEGVASKEFQMGVYTSLPNCYASCGEEMTGCANYNLTIKAHDSDKELFNLWFVDSGTYNTDESIDSYYAFVADDQLEWYRNTSNALKEQNGGVPMPSLLFQHIPVPEIFDLLTEVSKDTENAVKKNGKYYILNEELASGSLNEGPCPPDYNNGQFAAWKEQGDVLAAFFGHDHVNDFSGTLDGIDLVHTAGAGFESYGNGPEHGVRVIDISEKDLTYTSEMLYFKDLVDELNGGNYLLYTGAYAHNIIVIAIIAAVALLIAVSTVTALIVIKVRKKKTSVNV